jgi:hypothetical protein
METGKEERNKYDLRFLQPEYEDGCLVIVASWRLE